MKKLLLRAFAVTMIVSNVLVHGAEPIKSTLRVDLVGENTTGSMSLAATAKALDTAVVTGDVDEAKYQLSCLNAMVGSKADVVVKTDVQVQKGWFSNTVTKTDYMINGRDSLKNPADVEMVLTKLGFGTYQAILNTPLDSKVAYLQAYLRIMTESLNKPEVLVSSIQAFHAEFKEKFSELSAETPVTVELLTQQAQAAAIDAGAEEVLPTEVKSWFGTKTKAALGTAVILIALSAGRRTI